MKHYGIDNNYFLQPQRVASLPAWNSAYAESLIYALDTDTMYYGTAAGTWQPVSGNITAGYLHTQSSAATTWTVVHDLGQRAVNITVYDSSYAVMMPSKITATDTNTVTLTFPEAIAGSAVITAANATSISYTSQKVILGSPTQMINGDWKGKAINGVAGEALAQGDLVYCKLNGGAWKYYKYDANGTDKLILPTAVATQAVAQDGNGIFMREGLMRCDSWNLSGTADASTTVYASGTAGGLTMTAPSASGDEVMVIGFLLGTNVVEVKIGCTWLEVK